MNINFHNVRLPQYITIFAIGSSEFSTSLALSMSGREVRSSDTALPKRHYFLKNCMLSMSQFESFYSFFKARAGRRFSFRMRDHFDYKVEKQAIATGDGVCREFQLRKIYDDQISPYLRTITKPIADTVKLWTAQDEPIEPESIDTRNGKILLPSVLADNEPLSASFEFDTAVRFVNDDFQYSFNQDNTITLNNVELIEVHE